MTQQQEIFLVEKLLPNNAKGQELMMKGDDTMSRGGTRQHFGSG